MTDIPLPFTARGLEGQMTYDGSFVTITRRGVIPFLKHGANGRKSIPIRAVTAVQHRACGLFHGYLQLSVAGEMEHGNSFGRDQSLSRDENTVIFYFLANRSFRTLADSIRRDIQTIALGGAPGMAPPTTALPVVPTVQTAQPEVPPAPVTRPHPTRPDIDNDWSDVEEAAAKISELAELRNQGAITPAEFLEKKHQLLNRI